MSSTCVTEPRLLLLPAHPLRRLLLLPEHPLRLLLLLAHAAAAGGGRASGRPSLHRFGACMRAPRRSTQPRSLL